MKKILFPTLLLAWSFALSAQRIFIPDMDAYSKLKTVDSLVFTVQYDVTAVENREDPENPSKETMMLRVGKNVSEYYSYTSFVADSVVRADVMAHASQQTINEHLQQYGFGSFTHRIYKNYPKGKMTVFDRIVMDNFAVEEPMPEIKWVLQPDTATVCGYLCGKATTRLYGRDYEAWFARDIPQSDGPWKLHGLPGLILKAEDSQKHYRFVCTGIEASKAALPIEISETSRRNIPRKDLNKLLERYNADPQAYIRTNVPNVRLTVNDQMGNTIKKMSNPYNPIELE